MASTLSLPLPSSSSSSPPPPPFPSLKTPYSQYVECLVLAPAAIEVRSNHKHHDQNEQQPTNAKDNEGDSCVPNTTIFRKTNFTCGMQEF